MSPFLPADCRWQSLQRVSDSGTGRLGSQLLQSQGGGGVGGKQLMQPIKVSSSDEALSREDNSITEWCC